MPYTFGVPGSYLTNRLELGWKVDPVGSSFGTIPDSENDWCCMACDAWISPFKSPLPPFLAFFFLIVLADGGSIWDLNRE